MLQKYYEARKAPIAEVPTMESPLPIRQDGKVEAVHFSKVADLKEIDPTKYGTGISGAEKKRKANAEPGTWVDRQYFYIPEEGVSAKEAGLGPHKYTTSFDPSELYDIATDPQGLRDRDVTQYEKNIADAGYKGYWVDTGNPKMGKVVAYFDKVIPESYTSETAPAPKPESITVPGLTEKAKQLYDEQSKDEMQKFISAIKEVNPKQATIAQEYFDKKVAAGGYDVGKLSLKPGADVDVINSTLYKKISNSVVMGPMDEQLVAKDSKGNDVGRLWVTKIGDGFEVRKVEVEPKARRQGIAERLYSEAVNNFGVYKGSTDRTPEGKAFVASMRMKHPEWFADTGMPLEYKLQAANDLGKIFSEQLGRDVKFEPITEKDSKYEYAQKLAEVFNSEIHVVKEVPVPGQKTIGFNGVVVDGKRIFINAKASDPTAAIVMHETFHQLKENSPELYRDLLNMVELKGTEKFRQELNAVRQREGFNDLNPSAGVEELLANFMGEQVHNHQFMNKFLDNVAKTNPSLIQKLMQYFSELVDRVKTVFGSKTNQYIADLEATRNAAADIMAKYAIRQHEMSPQEYAQNWENKLMYHGAKKGITSLKEIDPLQYANESALYGPGLYLTDSRTIAEGYAKGKGKGGNVLAGKLGDVRLLNLEKPTSEDVHKIFSSILKDFGETPTGKTPSDLYDHLSEVLRDNDYTRQDAAEVLYGLQESLEDIGYDGFTHTGGLRTTSGVEHGPHTVVILFDTGNSEKSLLSKIIPVEQTPKFSMQDIAASVRDNKFIEDDVKPTVVKAVTGLKTIGDQFKRMAAPGYRTEDATKVQNEFREVLGKMYQKQYQAGAKLDELMRGINGQASTVSSLLDTVRSQGKTLADNYFARLPKEDAWDFMFRKDNGVAQTDATKQAIADFAGEMFDARVRALQALDIGVFDGLAVGPEGTKGENNPFFPRYWQKSDEALATIHANLARRPLEGQKTFLKQRVFGDIYEGMRAGYKLVSDNPIDLMFMKLNEIDRFIAAHTLLKSLEEQGIAKLHPADEFLPRGETNILGIFGTVKKPEGDGYKSYKYGVREDVAQVINNYLSPTLYNNKNIGQAFSAYMTAANHLNQMQLGVGSLFHGGFTSLETVITHVSLGLRAAADGNFAKAIKYFAAAPTEVYNNPKRGNEIMKAWATGNTTNDSIRNMPLIIEGLQLAGARKEMDQRFQTHATENMFNAWASGNKVGAAVRAPFAVIEQMARPLMEWLVPRQKFGVFGEMYNFWLDEHSNASHSEKQEAANQIWNRVDSRLGQVNYDRLFVNNTAKNLVQGALRAPGWTGGTILELGGGFKDVGTAIMDIANGRKPVLTDRTAYGLALVITTATINGMLTTLFTGEQPEGDDFIAFRTGNTDEHGFPERFMLPTYMKDLYAYANDTPTTLSHKLHPIIGVGKELVQNKDYYGTEIRQEGDNIAEQIGSVLGFTVKQFTPFWVRGLQKEMERGGSAFAEAAPLIGVMPAPSEMNRTPAEKMIRKFLVARTPNMTKTSVEFERAKQIMDLTRRVRAGEDVAGDIQEAVNNGEISTRSAKQIIATAAMSPIAAGFRRLSLDEANKVMEKATPQEQEELAPLLAEKEKRWQKLYPGGENTGQE